MNLIHLRFGNSLLAAQARIRCGQDRFQRLLKDKPTGRTIENKAVATTRDYRNAYLIKLTVSSVLPCITVLLSFAIFPEISTAQCSTCSR